MEKKVLHKKYPLTGGIRKIQTEFYSYYKPTFAEKALELGNKFLDFTADHRTETVEGITTYKDKSEYPGGVLDEYINNN